MSVLVDRCAETALRTVDRLSGQLEDITERGGTLTGAAAGGLKAVAAGKNPVLGAVKGADRARLAARPVALVLLLVGLLVFGDRGCCAVPRADIAHGLTADRDINPAAGRIGSGCNSGNRSPDHAFVVSVFKQAVIPLSRRKERVSDGMGIGASIFLIALGLILALAVDVNLSGIDLQLVGWILAVVGVVGLLITLTALNRRRTTVREEAVLREPPMVRREERVIREDPPPPPY